MKKRIRRHKLILLMRLFYVCILSISFSSTVTIAQSYIPTPGDWEGVTSQGKPVDFEVTQTSTHLKSFFLTYEKECGPYIISETWGFISMGKGIEIINNQFLLSSPGRAFTGIFTSDQTSMGTFNIFYYDYDLGETCEAAGTWTATPELLWSFKTFQPIIVNDSG